MVNDTSGNKQMLHITPFCHKSVLQQLVSSCVYPEPGDEVIAGQQVVDQELEGVVSGGLVEGKDIKRPLIHLLENI